MKEEIYKEEEENEEEEEEDRYTYTILFPSNIFEGVNSTGAVFSLFRFWRKKKKEFM